MGAKSSAQRDSRDEDEEPLAGLNVAPEEDSAEERKNGEISSLNGKAENQSDGLIDQCKERILIDDGSAFVIPKTDAPDPAQALQEQEVSQASTEDTAQDSTDDITGDGENVISDKLHKPEVCFKKIFRFGGLQFTLRKNSLDKTDAEEPVKNEQYMKDACPSLESWDTIEGEPVSINDQYEEDTRGDENAESTESDNKEAIGQISEITEHSEDITTDKRETEDVTQNPEPDGPMSPIKWFVTKGIFGSLRRKKNDKEAIKDSTEEQRKSIDKDVKGLCACAQEDSTCECLEFSNITLEEDKDLLTQKRDKSKSRVEEMQTAFEKEDVVQASPFKRLFKKLSTRRHKDTKTQTNLTEAADNLTENVQSTPELLKKKEESNIVEQNKAAEEDAITRPEGPKKRSDSIVSWESLICGGSLKRIVRKTSDCEEVKGELTRKATESPTGSSTESDYNNFASSNEQIGSHAETEGSTWKSFKKLVTPKRKSKTDESVSGEQIPSDTELTTDESFCSIRKLISAHRKKSDLQPENISSEEESKGTGTDNEVEETPAVVPMSEYEVDEPEHLQVMTEQTIESTSRKEVHIMTEEDKQEQKEPLVNPSYDAAVPIPSDYFEEVTEFLSKYQQLSDIPEEGIIEESVATPVSFVEWPTQDDTLAEDVADMTADAVTAPEHPTEDSNGDETAEMVSALSQLTESQKTSGNATPDPSVYDEGKSDLILQQVAETFCMAPSVLSIILNDKDPDTPRASDFSAIKTETKVLEGATAICVGLVSQNIGELRNNIPLPIVEGIFGINEAVPTELVYGEFTEDKVRHDKARIATDKVYVAELKELKTKFHQTVSRDPIATTAKAMGKSKQEIPQSDQDKVSHVTHMEERKEVHTTLLSETQLLRKQVISKNINKPESKTLFNPVLGRPAHEQTAQAINVTVVGEIEHRHTEVESTATNTQGEVAESAANKAVASVSDKSEALEITENDVQVNFADSVQSLENGIVVLSQSKASEITENSDRVIQAGNVELAHNDALGVAHSTMNRGSENTEDVVQGTQAEGAVLAVQNDAALVTDNTFEKSEITKDAVHATQVEDVEGVAYSNGETVSHTTLREEDVSSSAESIELVAHSKLVLVPESTSRDAPEMAVDVARVILTEGVELVSDSSAHEASEIIEDVVQVMLAEDAELVAHSKEVALNDSSAHEASEIIEDVVQVMLAEDAELVAHKYEVVMTENTLNEATENTDHVDQITQVKNVEFVAHSDVESIPESTLRDAPEIAEDVARVILTEGVELVGDAKEVVLTDSTVHEASEFTEDAARVTPVENVEFVEHSKLVSIPESTFRDASEIIEDVVHVMLAEGAEMVAHKYEVVITDNTFHEATENTDHVDQITLVDVELVAHSKLVSVSESTRDAPELADDVVQVMSAEGVELVAHKLVSVPESTLRDAPEIAEDVARVMLDEGVELVGDAKEVVLTDSTVHEASEFTEDAARVTPVENVEFVEHSKLVSIPESTFRDAPVIIEDVVQVMLAEGAEMVAHKYEVVVTDNTTENTDHVDQITLVENVDLVTHSEVVSVPESTLRVVSEMTEDVVQVMSAEGVKMVAHKYEVVVTENTLHDATENTDHVDQITLVDVELVAHSKLVSVSESTRDAPELADDVVQVMSAESIELVAHKLVSVPESTSRDAPEMAVDVARVILTEGVELVAHRKEVALNDSSAHEASEIIEDVVQVMLAEDVEMVAHKYEVVMTENTLNEATENTDHVDQITLVENVEFVAHSDVESIPESTLRDASEIAEDVSCVMLAEGVELVGDAKEVVLTDSTVHEASEFTEDAARVTPVENAEFVEHSKLVSIPESTLRDASEIIEDVVQVMLAEGAEMVAHKYEVVVTDNTTENTDHIDQITPSENVDLVTHSDVVSVPESTLRGVSEMTEDAVQVMSAESVELVEHAKEVLLTDSTVHEALEFTKDATRVSLVEIVEFVAHSDVVSVPESTLRGVSEMIEDAVKVIKAEDTVYVANNVVLSITDSTLHEASEIADHIKQVTLVEDSEFVAQSDVVSVFERKLRDTSENVVKVTQAEDTVQVANNIVSSGTDSTFNEVPEFKDDAVQVTLAMDDELIANSDEVLMSHTTLRESSKCNKQIIRVTHTASDVLEANNTIVSLLNCALNDASDIKNVFAQDTLTKDAELVAHHNELAVPIITVSDNMEDTNQITLDEKIELESHNDVVSLPASTLREATDISVDVVKVTQAEIGMYITNSDLSSVTDSTLNKASEITDNVEVTQAKDVELIAHSDVESEFDSILREVTEIMLHVNVTQAEGLVLVANNACSVPNSTSNEASEFKDNSHQARLVEDVELAVVNDKLSVTDRTLNEGLSIAEDVVNVTRAQYTVLAAQNVVASAPANNLNEASEITEDAVMVAHDLVLLPLSTIIRSSENTDDVTQAEDGMLVVSMPDGTFNKPSEITEHNNGVSAGYTDSVFVSDHTLNEDSKVTKVTHAGVGMSVGQRVVDLVPENTLNEASEITENGIQSIQSMIVKTVTHNVLSSGPISTINRNVETTDDALDTLAKAGESAANNNEASATDTTINKVSEVAGEMTSIFPTDNRNLSTVSSVSDSIQVEAEKEEFINGQMNTESVLHAVEMAKKTTQPKIESMAVQNSRDTAVKKIVQSTELQNIQETDETSCHEKEAIILENKCHLHISATCEESREVEAEGISKGTLGLVPDHMTKPRTGGEIFLVTLKENKPDEQSQQTSAIFKEPQVHEKLAEEECQPLTVENPKLKQQECHTDSKLAIDTYTTDEALGFKMKESPMTEETERPYVESLRSDTLSEDIKELTITAMPVHSDFLSEPQETKQEGSTTNYEPKVATHRRKPDESQSVPENCEKGSLQMNETVLVEALKVTGEVLSEQKADVIVDVKQNTEYAHLNTQEMVSKFYSIKTAEKNTEMQSIVLKVERAKDNDERQITRFTEQMTETEMVTETLERASVPAVLKTVSVKTENDIQETSSPISVIQTEDMMPLAPIPAACAVLTDTLLSGEASEEGDININTVTEVELQERNLDMTIATSETMVFTKPNRQTIVASARETETMVATCQETNTEILDPVGILAKNNITFGLSGFSTRVTESQLKSVITAKEPILAQEDVVPEVKKRLIDVPVNSEIQQLPLTGCEVNLTGATQEDHLEVQ